MSSWCHIGRGAAIVAVGAVALSMAAPSSASSEPPVTQGSPPTGVQEHEPSTNDRYGLANGCFAVRSVALDRYVTRSGESFVAGDHRRSAAEPFHFRATDLGRYLLHGSSEDFLGVKDSIVAELLDELEGSSPGAILDGATGGVLGNVLGDVRRGPLGGLAGRGAAVGIASSPSELADWELTERAGAGGGVFRLGLPALDAVLTVNADGSLGLVAGARATAAADVSFVHTEGCADWPEVEVNVDGRVAAGPTPHGETRGYLDAHMHGMAFEFLGGRARCGKPWHPYGVEHALQGCPEHELLGGRTHVLETVLSGRDPVAGHDTTGWPTFDDWPAHFSLTYEQTYYRWLERAWRSGLRMYTNLFVDNNKLCQLYPFKHNSCNEMDGVRLQAQRLREFERYVDAQHGGPGKGWLRIVTDPFEAREVINDGRLAVVMGIEVSVLFDCGMTLDVPHCDTEQIDRQLADVYDLGVRQMEIINKFDNALGGVAGDAEATGVLVNSANFLETGSFWQMGACDEHHDHDHVHDRTQHNLHDDAGLPDELTGRNSLIGAIMLAVGETGTAPVYGPGPHCNQRGLTELGVHLIHRMVERGMIFDPDHLSAHARHEALDVIEEAGYSGVVSSHSWADEGIYQRIYQLGGVVTPMAGSSTNFVDEWREHREWADDRFLFGFGYGSDINGFAAQGAPRGADVDNPVTYPFEGFGGVTVHQQVSGDRVYDVNTDGVAHYGLYPDWIEDLRQLAGDEIIADLELGPEAYLQMWERAVGVAPDSCRTDVEPLSRDDVRRVQPGMTPPQVLTAVGQPTAREGSSFTYCVTGGRTATVLFDAAGRVERVRTTAAQHQRDDATPLGGAGIALGVIGLGLTAARRRSRA